jgi:putative transposase
MTRPLRLEYAGALYHVTARGDRKEAIYKDHFDHVAWLGVLGSVCDRCNLVVHSFCQMGNHYHLLLETPDGNLAQGMRQLNGSYTQYFNRRHHLSGHVFQGRYKAILVQKESYLLELVRYIVLNPLRANMVASLDAWQWSSHHHVIGRKKSPPWLATDCLLGLFGNDRASAIEAYSHFVMRGHGMPSPLREVKHQFILGDKNFIEEHRFLSKPDTLPEIVRAQRRPLALTLQEYQSNFPERDLAMAQAYATTAYTMAQIGRHFGVTYRTVSRAVQRFAERTAGKPI